MARIGKSNRMGGIGRPGKRKGWLGKTSGTQGSALIPDQDYPPVFYPSTTSTTSSTTSTSSSSSTASSTSSSSSTASSTSTLSTTSSSTSTSTTTSTTA